MNANELAAQLARRFEGFRARPYLCPAGIPTIGYGFTRYPDGRAVLLTDPPMTRDHADQMLVWFIRNRYLPEVLKLCMTLDRAEQIAAITDFNFNCGSSALKASTLRKRILAREWDRVPGELMKWTRGGGRVLPGLVTRRAAEAALWSATTANRSNRPCFSRSPDPTAWPIANRG